MTTLLSKAEEATAEIPVNEDEIADLEKQVSEQGTVVSKVKEVRFLPHSSVSCTISNACLEQCHWAPKAV